MVLEGQVCWFLGYSLVGWLSVQFLYTYWTSSRARSAWEKAPPKVSEGYTAGVAAKLERQWRSGPNVLPKDLLADAALRTCAIPVTALAVAVTFIVTLFFLPCCCCRRRHDPRVRNISNDQGGSATAVATCWMRTEAYFCGFGTDYVAPSMLHQMSFLPGVPCWHWLTRFVVAASRAAWFLARATISDALFWHYRKKVKIGHLFLHLRTCFFDDQVEAFLERFPEGQLVILGAGFDTRCHRVPGGHRRFEVDAPGTQAAKRRVAPEHPGIVYVAVDFESGESWMEKLVHRGFDVTVPTCFIWEGVTPYLSEEVVKHTLEDFKACAPGSIIGFDYVCTKLFQDATFQKRLARLGEPMLWACDRDAVPGFVKGCGLRVLDHPSNDEVLERYSPRRADGSFLIAFGPDTCGFVIVGKQ